MSLLKKALFSLLLSLTASQLAAYEFDIKNFVSEYNEPNTMMIRMADLITQTFNSYKRNPLGIKIILRNRLDQLASLLNSPKNIALNKHISFGGIDNRTQDFNFSILLTPTDTDYADILFKGINEIKNKTSVNLFGTTLTRRTTAKAYSNFLIPFFESLGTDLWSIDLSGHEFFSTKKIHHKNLLDILLDFLCKNRNITFINLDGNYLKELSDENLSYFFSKLASSLTNLAEIEVGMNGLSQAQLNIIGDALQLSSAIDPIKLLNTNNQNDSDSEAESES